MLQQTSANKPSIAKTLLSDFGSKTEIGRRCIELFMNNLIKKESKELVAKVVRWENFYKQIYGETVFNSNLSEEFTRLYRFNTVYPFNLILLSVQTYYALVIKLVVNEIVQTKLHLDNTISLYDFSKQSTKNDREIFHYLEFIETGGYCSKYVFKNFMDGSEFFNWYLNAWDDDLAKLVENIISKILSNQVLFDKHNFEPKDNFKDFYQSLLPQKIRKLLGEVYTPQWLAEFVIEDTILNSIEEKNLLDPSCGSGIFFLLFLNKKRLEINSNTKPNDVLQILISGFLAFDINPLALLTARANFLYFISDLINHIDTPFIVPIILEDLLGKSFNNVLVPVSDEGNLKIPDTKRKFDFILGNPPWINWEYLPESYKRNGMELWKKYGLFTASNMNKMLGEAKYDISSVFIYKLLDEYLKEKGILHFVIPTILIRGKPGQGFRKYFIESKTGIKYFKLIEINDLAAFRPFTHVNTKVALIKFEIGSETTYPVPYLTWTKKETFSQEESWAKVCQKIEISKMYAKPVDKQNKTSNLLVFENTIENENWMESVFKPSNYKAFEGSNTEGLNTAFWITNISGSKKEIVFDNINKSQKKPARILLKQPIETELVFPLLRSKNINKWTYTIDAFIIFTLKYDETKQIAQIENFQRLYPLTYQYFKNFEKDLKLRSSFKNKSKNKPFYLIYGKESMKNKFKVVWNRMGNEITAVVTELYNHPLLGEKPPIPQETIVYIPTETLEEAYYISGVMNSKLFSKFVSMIHITGSKGFGTPDILEKIFIPKFDFSLPIHNSISDISRKIHQEFNKMGEKRLFLENTLNREVSNLYGLSKI